jgi:hypothetical protein
VRRQIVQNERVAWLQARAEHLLEINSEDFGIDWSVDQQRGCNLFVAQGGNEGRAPPMTMGHRA